MAHKVIFTRSESKGNMMDLSKVDRLHQSLSATFMVMCTEESANPTEALTVAMRLFSSLLAAYVADADIPQAALCREIEAHCRDAAAMARSRLLEIRDYDPFDADEDEDAGPV